MSTNETDPRGKLDEWTRDHGTSAVRGMADHRAGAAGSPAVFVHGPGGAEWATHAAPPIRVRLESTGVKVAAVTVDVETAAPVDLYVRVNGTGVVRVPTETGRAMDEQWARFGMYVAALMGGELEWNGGDMLEDFSNAAERILRWSVGSENRDAVEEWRKVGATVGVQYGDTLDELFPEDEDEDDEE